MTQNRLEPLWQPRQQLRHTQIPQEWQSWLYNDESLTARLKGACDESFRVEVLEQRYESIEPDEADAMSIPPDEEALLREVYLYCGEQRMVYARSVIPTSTLTGPEKQLENLGDQPLGAFLFNYPGMRRDEIELASFDQQDTIFKRATDGLTIDVDDIWGRRSVFWLGTKPLLVAEIFLPAVTELRA